MDDNMMDKMNAVFLRQRPNSYTLTKAVSESLVLDERGTLPVAIVRPSIVTASWKEPFPGWLDNYNGCTGIMVSCGVGLIKSVLAEKDCVADVIPMDIAANTLIAVAWHTATARPEHVDVYNCTSGTLQRQTWGDVGARTQELIVRHPLPNVTGLPKFTVTNNVLWHNFILFFLSYLPAFFGDLVLKLTGQKPRYVSLYRKFRKGIDAVEYFTTNSWLFRSNNVVALLDNLSPTDKELFSFDIRNVQLPLYWDQYMLGIHKYLFTAKVSHPAEVPKHM